MNTNHRFVLLGPDSGKRTDYYRSAAELLHKPVITYSLEDYPAFALPGDLVKIDPPPFEASDINELKPYIDSYKKQLKKLDTLTGIHYLNEPSQIWSVLDKYEAKKNMETHGIPTTKLYEFSAGSYNELLQVMREHYTDRVFIKPRYGSGAAGVIAFRYHFKTGQEAMYTSIQPMNNTFYNTKRLKKSHDKEWNERVINYMLSQDVIFEHWMPKDSVNGIHYDLRILWMEGKILHIIPRGSRYPITNLHLNNMALDLDMISLTGNRLDNIQLICKKLQLLYPGLRCMGIDMLIPRDGIQPYVIEINGQGDLIYKDIYKENSIYRHQINYLLKRSSLECKSII